jgi:putative transposase
LPYWRTFYHLIWATQHREPLIGAAEEAAIRRSLTMTFTELKLIPHEVGIVEDHMHVAVSVPPAVAVSEVVKRLKGASSHAVNQACAFEDDRRFRWQSEYGAITFGERSLPMVVEYLQKQREHHANSTTLPQFERIESDPDT